MSDESLLVKTSGGPFGGESRVVPSGVLGWPPPTNLPGIFHGGVYILVNFSKQPVMSTRSRTMRVADYEWREVRKG